MSIEENAEIWRKYYEAALSRRHHDRTERALTLNKSKLKVAIDCGCGTGADIEYMAHQGYYVHGFDVNPDSVSICQSRH